MRLRFPSPLRRLLASAAILLCTVLFSWCAGHAADPAGAPLPRMRLWVVCTGSVFPEANRNDTITAGTLWMRNIGHRRGFTADVRFELVDDLAAVRRRVQAGTVDMVLSDPAEYLELSRLGVLKPAVSLSQRAEVATYRYLLLGLKGGGSTVDALRGRSVLIHARSGPTLPRLWLSGLLRGKHLGAPEQFFSSLDAASRPTAACLPVFFGKPAACVVDSTSWDVMREMNPQLNARLQVLADSPPVTGAVASVHDGLVEGRAEVLQALVELHQEPEGRQLLTMFRTTRLIQVGSRDFDGVREILRNAGEPSSSVAGAGGAEAHPAGNSIRNGASGGIR